MENLVLFSNAYHQRRSYSERKDESQNNNNNKNIRLVGKMIPSWERMICLKKYLPKNLEKSVPEPVVFKVF